MMAGHCFILKLAILLFYMTVAVRGRCSTEEIHEATSTCLTDSHVERGTDPLVPVLNDTAAVINFCLRHISDIKNCITNVISPCTSDKRVKVIFGTTGAALLAAYDGLCSEKNKNIDMTCAYDYMQNISIVVNEVILAVDSLDQQSASFSDLCKPVHELMDSIMRIYETAVQHGHCSQASMDVMHQYLATILFPCNDVATTYYPCTIAQLNVDAIDCFAKNGLIVSNALVPTPGSLSNADEMCSSKSTIQSCIKSHITRCLHEPQVTTLFGSAVEYYEAAYNCMCSLENFDMILSCAATADVTSAMTEFTSKIHQRSKAGTLDKQSQCSMENVMASQIRNALGASCSAQNMKEHWKTYMSTVIYPCTEAATACYPRNMYSGGEPLDSLRALLIAFTGLVLALQFL